jgi:hypothetical protein
MIAAGILKATANSSKPFFVTILVSDKEVMNHPISYFLGNIDNIPFHIKDFANAGEPVAIIVEFDPADQFAYYRSENEIKLRVPHGIGA